MSHGDQAQDVEVVVGGADGRWLQVHRLLLVEGGDGQHQAHLATTINTKEHTGKSKVTNTDQKRVC